MKMTALILITLFSVNTLALTKKKPFFVHLKNIHPTQAYIGMDQIPVKIKKLTKEFEKQKYKKYLKKKWAPAVLGPDKRYWIIDRHHLSYSILHFDLVKKKGIYIKLIKDWSNLDWHTFKIKMLAKDYLYLKDDKFNSIHFEDIPNSLSQLQDNPYRSLAYFAREEECFKKVEIPFLEFTWGEYFYKEGIVIDSNFELSHYIKMALKKCHLHQARDLPGFYTP